MVENKVKGQADSIVSEMIKQLHKKQFYDIIRYFQDRMMELEEARSSWKIVRTSDAEPEKRNKKLPTHRGDVGDVDMVCDLCNSSVGKKN